MAKADRILEFFPSYCGATDSTKLLHEVTEMLAWPLEEADTHLLRIQRAHRLKVAEQADDIVKLAGALNLTAFHFEDILSDKDLDYETKLSLMRDRVRRVARVHLVGLGTPVAILETAAIFLNATVVSEKPGAPLIVHSDHDGFSHRATIEFSHFPEKPRDQIFLYENPIRRKKIEPAERWQLNSWIVENVSPAPAPVRLLIEGVSDHTVLPSVFCPDTGEGILFNGFIPAGKKLVIDQFNGATLDQHPVDDWVIYFKGGIFDFAGVNSSDFSQPASQEGEPLDTSSEEELVAAAFHQPAKTPAAPTGRSEWRFKVAEGVCDGTLYDFSAFTTPNEAVGIYDNDFNYDGCVFDFDGGAIVGLAWDERIPCSFKLVLPANVPRPAAVASAPPAEPGRTARNGSSGAGSEPSGRAARAPDPAPNCASRIGSILPRFKPAGIRAFVDNARPAWILGQSSIRDESAKDGEGISVHPAVLRTHGTEMLAPLDAGQ
ncbi:MAG TPA: hypothetical protein VIG25_17330 [Pyrinomonadaceae bacterium]|jgi:hypothetical protein